MSEVEEVIEGRGIYIHATWSREPEKGVAEVKEDIDLIAKSNFNFIAPYMRSGDRANYRKSSILPKLNYLEWDPLEVIVKEAHDKGLEVYPIICTLVDGGFKLGEILTRHPEWAMVTKDGRRIGWADPAKPEVVEYEVSIVREIVENYNVDGIILDYIRFPEREYGETCYCKYCRSKFEEEYGTDPIELKEREPLADKWDDWRRERVSLLVKRISEEVHKLGADLKLGAYFYAGVTNRYYVFQDWPAWIRRGYLDFSLPSGSFYEYASANMSLLRRSCLFHRRVTLDTIPSYVTIHVTSSGGVLKPGELLWAIKIARETGMQGVALFDWESLEPKTGIYSFIGYNPLLAEARMAFAKKAKIPHRVTNYPKSLRESLRVQV